MNPLYCDNAFINYRKLITENYSMSLHHPSNALTSYIPWTHTLPPWNSGKRKVSTMKLASKLGRASSESGGHKALTLKDCGLTLTCWNAFPIAESCINTPYRWNEEGTSHQDGVSHPLPFFHFPRLFTTNTRATPPELIMDSQAAI